MEVITLAVVQRAVAGEKAAMEQIMRSLERPFFNLALRMLLSTVEAEDAAQECLLRVATRLAQFEGGWFRLSEAPDGYDFLPRTHSQSVEQFFDALKLSNVTLMAQDWGGPIGLGVAGGRPELVKSLVIGNSWAWPKDGDPNARRFSAFMGGPIGRFLGLNFNGIPHMFFAIGTRDRLPDEAFEMYLRPFRRPDRREPTVIFPREIIASGDYLGEVEKNLAHIADRPTLIVWGAKDGGFRTADRERFERTFANHRTVILETAKHFIQEDEPVRVAAEIRSFLGDTAHLSPLTGAPPCDDAP